jgi:hypothetical protein
MININKPIENKDRKFGSANVYFLSQIVNSDGNVVYGLFTQHELQVAMKRAENNIEDIVPVAVNSTIFGRFLTWLSRFFGSTTRK